MAKMTLAHRVAALELEVARLKAKLVIVQGKENPWTQDVWGAFAGDQDFLEAMRLGRQWRESFRPKPRKRRKLSAVGKGKAR